MQPGPRAAVFNMRDGYDIYPLTGLATLQADCQPEAQVVLRPVAFGWQGSIVWGHWGKSGAIRAWSTSSGRIVVELNHSNRVAGLTVC